jgi:hypothetical protein
MSRSIRIIGWSTALCSMVIILSEFSSLLTNPMEQLSVVFQMFPQAKNSMDTMADTFLYNRIWSVYTILYFWFVLYGSIQFIQFHSIGRKILEIACWIGLANACIDSLLSYILWKQLQSILSSATGSMGMGMSLGNLNPLGMITIIFSFFLWVIPTIGMMVYLRKPALKALMK